MAYGQSYFLNQNLIRAIQVLVIKFHRTCASSNTPKNENNIPLITEWMFLKNKFQCRMLSINSCLKNSKFMDKSAMSYLLPITKPQNWTGNIHLAMILNKMQSNLKKKMKAKSMKYNFNNVRLYMTERHSWHLMNSICFDNKFSEKYEEF